MLAMLMPGLRLGEKMVGRPRGASGQTTSGPSGIDGQGDGGLGRAATGRPIPLVGTNLDGAVKDRLRQLLILLRE